MRIKKTYEEQTPVNEAKEGLTVAQTIFDCASRGLSERAIAVRLGLPYLKFQELLNIEKKGVQPYRLAYDAGVAEWEEYNVSKLEEALEEGSIGIKAKVARDNLKTMEHWAPATKTVKVQVEDSRVTFEFEAYSDDELQSLIDARDEEDDESNVDKE